MVRLLTPDGERVPHPDYELESTPGELRGLYRDMVLARAADGEGVTLQRQGELALWPSLLGQEAAQIGSARALRDDDHVFPSYRDHGVALCRGLDPLHIFRLYRGVTHGGWDPAEHHFHLYTLVIGSQVLHATGYAMGVAADDAGTAVAVYFGDGATSQGDVSEAFNFAAVYNAPVVFFCQNNQWAISAGNERQFRAPIFRRAAGFGFPGVRVDGNDVLACLAVTRAALARARSGAGPMLIEAFTYRMGAHTTADDATRYRDPVEVEEWRGKDPIARLGLHLRKTGLADDEFFARTDREGADLAARLRSSVRAMPDPGLADAFGRTYGDEHPLVAEELAWFREYSASFAAAGEG
ncbi:pyruvate dehydrogenase (acetyl-transferring) E1 component subunit alpha [Actinomadura rayongensis]|uniref:Pyruvate dehydrogenase (Acetyl-transferring) E1 component subunit alpha n=1 Tax=Actinomadura rayongensis TaxID=1429076 RepID=A0A6I4WF32_9ACTN|nr:pyruvate dehydrogenase (acetyl-transferring) E1 component subunit alpha [Actinomadura rayongensis]MXQ65534.1 pyruvate dehydrogenase (acetyl-transferring) E1 component subunit alpha [Actinomadura rayongensis]